MSRNTVDPGADFEQLARQYWTAWSQMAGKSGGVPEVPGWKDGLAWWSQLAGQGRGDIDAALERMNSQAGHWFGAMQQLAAGFAGREAAPADIAKAWSEMLSGAGTNPLADMFKRMGGADARGIEEWMAQAAPFLSGMRGDAGALLNLPAFGLGREHQERLQRFAHAQLAYQDRVNEYNGELARVAKLAFARFETKLAEHSEPGRQIESARALFDLWIDAAEEAWAEVALSPEYRRIYGALVNAQMRLRAGLQREIELAAGLFGLPTRSEINGSHRKLAALEREVRALKAQLAATGNRIAANPLRREVETSTEVAPVAKSRAKAGAPADAMPVVSTRMKAAVKSGTKPVEKSRAKTATKSRGKAVAKSRDQPEVPPASTSAAAGAPKRGATKRGATKRGATKRGATKRGATKRGATKRVMAKRATKPAVSAKRTARRTLLPQVVAPMALRAGSRAPRSASRSSKKGR